MKFLAPWILIVVAAYEVLAALHHVVSPIPGQEERNADFLLESGAALKAIDAATLEYKVHLLLERPDRLEAMRERMREQAKPDAASSVLRLVSEHL